MGTIVKMCVKCQRLLSIDSLVCPDCGGVLFETVDLMVESEIPDEEED